MSIQKLFSRPLTLMRSFIGNGYQFLKMKTKKTDGKLPETFQEELISTEEPLLSEEEEINQGKEPFPFEDLPYSVIIQILEMLPSKEKRSFRFVSQRYNQLCESIRSLRIKECQQIEIFSDKVRLWPNLRNSECFVYKDFSKVWPKIKDTSIEFLLIYQNVPNEVITQVTNLLKEGSLRVNYLKFHLSDEETWDFNELARAAQPEHLAFLTPNFGGPVRLSEVLQQSPRRKRYSVDFEEFPGLKRLIVCCDYHVARLDLNEYRSLRLSEKTRAADLLDHSEIQKDEHKYFVEFRRFDFILKKL